MVNYACAVSQSELGKYFEWIITNINEWGWVSYEEGHQHGGRKPVETSGVYFGSLKVFFLSAKLENIRIDTSLKILVIQNSKHKANQ